MSKTKVVVRFILDLDSNILLIKKNRPNNIKDMYNRLDSKIEQNKTIKDIDMTNKPNFHTKSDFTYHKPNESQINRMKKIREKAAELGNLINDYCPYSIEASTSYCKLREVVMWANASIVINESETRKQEQSKYEL